MQFETNEKYFTWLYNHYYKTVFKCALFFSKGNIKEDAEDISQEVFIKIFGKMDDLRSKLKTAAE